MRNDRSLNMASVAALPSVDEVLAQPTTQSLIADMGRDRVVAVVRTLIDRRRKEILAGSLHATAIERSDLLVQLERELERFADSARREGVRRLINATGTIIHTNLGRAPLSANAAAAMLSASGYSAIEYDIPSGSRGPRGPRAVDLLKRLTGAEDVLIVNNCAAAAMLILSVFAQGREVIVSRGELVEIGGDFRIPDILSRTGATLREVGTTNRTKLSDYENAISERTAMILKVHPSNFRITGFTKTADTAELAGLAAGSNLIVYEDAGSGALIDLSGAGIKGEPVIRDVLAAGADLVSFSGDKLLGGPQAGIIAGRGDLIERLRRDPFYRALRLDKTITAALEATLEAYSRGSASAELPVLTMLFTRPEEIAGRAAAFAGKLAESVDGLNGLQVGLRSSRSAVGGGASPDAVIETTVLTLKHSRMSDAQIEEALRLGEPPVITRIEGGEVLIDLRTVSLAEEAELVEAVLKLGNVPVVK